MVLEEKYDFKKVEAKGRVLWDKSGIYTWSKNSDSENFVIDTPPPTISGKLHMGHVFSYCQTDFIARYQRMCGKNVFYPIGFDDNGLPTERLVEKIKKIKAAHSDKAQFVEVCQQVSADSRQEFKALFRTIGISYDWNLEYHTISKDSCTISQMSFIDLYNKDLIYRKSQPILWDTVDQTAIAQAEIEDKEVVSSMNTIVFSTEDGQQLHIATTRPEMLPACVAVFYHPDDERYVQLAGRFAITPIFSQKVPILSDDRVKIDKGTGLVMCCTFGDELDIYWWQTHDLPTKIILNKYGKLCNVGNEEIDGLAVLHARKKVLEMLQSNHLLYLQEEISHSVKCAERSGSPLEILPTEQWFVRVLEHKEALLEKVREVNWHPPSMRKRIEIWIEGLNWDWCISRQRYFGVPFPVWYSKKAGEEGKVLLPDISQLPIDPQIDLPAGYTRDEVVADVDVMDTWATSSLTPQFNTKAVTEQLSLQGNDRGGLSLPADLRPQSHEIIRTWAFYTIVKAYYHSNTMPWKNIMISGWCLAEDKTKMSKSKGNVVTPQNILESYGADVIRYWAANSRLGVDTAFSPELFKVGQRLVNKIWNASKFVSGFARPERQQLGLVTEILDLWILSTLRQVIVEVTESFERFEYCEALEKIEKFFWHDFCDNYLELVKKRAYGEAIEPEKSASAIITLNYVLNKILCLFAPFLPYITEEILSCLYDGFVESSVRVHGPGSWPAAKNCHADKDALEAGKNSVSILAFMRKIKSQNNLSMKVAVPEMMIHSPIKLPGSAERDLKEACNAEKISWHQSDSLMVDMKL